MISISTSNYSLLFIIAATIFVHFLCSSSFVAASPTTSTTATTSSSSSSTPPTTTNINNNDHLMISAWLDFLSKYLVSLHHQQQNATSTGNSSTTTNPAQKQEDTAGEDNPVITTTTWVCISLILAGFFWYFSVVYYHFLTKIDNNSQEILKKASSFYTEEAEREIKTIENDIGSTKKKKSNNKVLSSLYMNLKIKTEEHRAKFLENFLIYELECIEQKLYNTNNNTETAHKSFSSSFFLFINNFLLARWSPPLFAVFTGLGAMSRFAHISVTKNTTLAIFFYFAAGLLFFGFVFKMYRAVNFINRRLTLIVELKEYMQLFAWYKTCDNIVLYHFGLICRRGLLADLEGVILNLFKTRNLSPMTAWFLDENISSSTKSTSTSILSSTRFSWPLLLKKLQLEFPSVNSSSCCTIDNQSCFNELARLLNKINKNQPSSEDSLILRRPDTVARVHVVSDEMKEEILERFYNNNANVENKNGGEKKTKEDAVDLSNTNVDDIELKSKKTTPQATVPSTPAVSSYTAATVTTAMNNIEEQGLDATRSVSFEIITRNNSSLREITL